MRRAIQFPKLEPPPQDFLTQMEEYCREAPRPLDAKHPGPKTVRDRLANLTDHVSHCLCNVSGCCSCLLNGVPGFALSTGMRGVFQALGSKSFFAYHSASMADASWTAATGNSALFCASMHAQQPSSFFGPTSK